jgi:hypothetical protein
MNHQKKGAFDVAESVAVGEPGITAGSGPFAAPLTEKLDDRNALHWTDRLLGLGLDLPCSSAPCATPVQPSNAKQHAAIV